MHKMLVGSIGVGLVVSENGGTHNRLVVGLPMVARGKYFINASSHISRPGLSLDRDCRPTPSRSLHTSFGCRVSPTQPPPWRLGRPVSGHRVPDDDHDENGKDNAQKIPMKFISPRRAPEYLNAVIGKLHGRSMFHAEDSPNEVALSHEKKTATSRTLHTRQGSCDHQSGAPR